jgi:hypothetical protein
MQLEFEELTGIRVCCDHAIVLGNQEEGLDDILLGLHAEANAREQQDACEEKGSLPQAAAADLREKLQPGINPYRTTRRPG